MEGMTEQEYKSLKRIYDPKKHELIYHNHSEWRMSEQSGIDNIRWMHIQYDIQCKECHNRQCICIGPIHTNCKRLSGVLMCDTDGICLSCNMHVGYGKSTQEKELLETVEETEGVRQNEGKPMFEVFAHDLELERAKGLTIGQVKYKEKAFNKGGNVMKLTTGYGSLRRHLNAFMNGEDIDPDDKIHHIAKAMNCLEVMWHNRKIGDDRGLR